MDPLSITASITALLQLTSTVIQYVNGVRGAAEDRGRILSELAGVNSILLILQDEADRDEQDDQWSSTFESLNRPGGPLEQFRMALERLSSKLAPSATGLKKMGKAISWPFQKEEVKEILSSVERQKALLNLARQNDHINLSKAIKDDTTIIRNQVDEVTKGVSKIQVNQISSEIQNIICWLDGSDPSTNYNKALKERNPKTGSWFIRSNEYAEWMNTKGSLLWLYGIPGCGKTILSSTILQNVLDYHHTKSNSAVVFFYFDFNDIGKQRNEKMIRSLISQFSKYCANSLIQDLYASCLNGSRQPTEELLLNTLRQMIVTLGDTYIILDALDECDDRSDLLASLEQIMSWEDVNLHTIVTSRREQDIEEVLTPLTDTEKRISIQSKLVDADIRTYVHDRLQIDRKLSRWQKKPKVQSEIEDNLMRKAGGMFRWVACQLDLLGDCFNLPQLRHALASLPKTLDDTYARILCNIDKNYSHCNREILKMLHWLTFSARPLRLEELAEIVAIDDHETPRFDPERRWPEPREIMAICSSLVTLTAIDNSDSDFDDDHDDDVDCLTEESGSQSGEGSQDHSVRPIIRNPPSKDSMYVRLAHFSVKEYLVSERIRHSIAIHYSVQEIVSHGVLAEDCIAYLLQFDNSGSLTRETLELYPLADYAAAFWAYHAKQAERIPIESTSQMATDFLQSDGGGILSWIGIADPDQDYRIYDFNLTLKEIAPPIYYASLVGLHESVRMLIQRGTDVNAQGGCYGNALQAASYSGHEDIVQVLLDSEADVNAQGGYFGNALQAASYSGHEDIVQVLLNKGVDVNAHGGVYGNALQAASQTGHMDTVQVLLNKGADTNAQGGYYGNSLNAACMNGSEDLVRMLLEKGADINALEPEGSALQLVSKKGFENAVNMLLDMGLEINAIGLKSSALQRASRWGNKNLVKLLLDKGAEINAIGPKGSALQLASMRCHEDVVKILLDEGAEINAIGPEGSALQLASKKGFENVVNMLLDKGADINALDSARWSALQLASREGHRNLVKMLLNKGADINAIGPEGSALQLASRSGYKNLVKMLLDKGSEINAVGPRGSALRLASMWNNESVVEMLLDHGADLNADPDDTAVQAAFRIGQTKSVKILVAKGAVTPEERGQSSSSETTEEEEGGGGGEADDSSRVETLEDPDTIETLSVQQSSSVQN